MYICTLQGCAAVSNIKLQEATYNMYVCISATAISSSNDTSKSSYSTEINWFNKKVIKKY